MEQQPNKPEHNQSGEGRDWKEHRSEMIQVHLVWGI